MRAAKGDHIHFRSSAVGRPEHDAEVLEVRGPDGEPPYRVRFEDGHESLVFPGSDCQVEHPA